MSDIILTAALPGAPIRNFTDFINQHVDCHRPAVEDTNHLQAVWFYEESTFEEYKQEVDYEEGKKFAFSVRPEPDLWGDMTPEWFGSFAKPANVTKVVVFTIPTNAAPVFAKIQQMADTSDVLFYDDIPTMIGTNEEYSLEIMDRLTDYQIAHEFEWFTVNMWELLNKNHAEYQKLINLLGLQALDDWKARIDQIHSDWF